MIALTETAKEQINQLIDLNATKKGISPESLYLRVYVAGGGCGGVSYGLAITSEARNDDIVVESGNVQILIDRMSVSYVEGAEVDYINHELGARFKINPRADLNVSGGGGGGGGCGSGSCGCGA